MCQNNSWRRRQDRRSYSEKLHLKLQSSGQARTNVKCADSKNEHNGEQLSQISEKCTAYQNKIVTVHITLSKLCHINKLVTSFHFEIDYTILWYSED